MARTVLTASAAGLAMGRVRAVQAPDRRREQEHPAPGRKRQQHPRWRRARASRAAATGSGSRNARATQVCRGWPEWLRGGRDIPRV